MSVEYYIVKPKDKKIFYLGKRINNFDGIPTWHYKKEAEYAQWECYTDVISDLWENNEYFFEADLNVGQIRDFCYAIYEFCNAPVYLDNDCNDSNLEWRDYDEIDTFSDLLSSEEQWSELALLIPEEYHITDETGNILYELETVKNYILKTQKEKQSV